VTAVTGPETETESTGTAEIAAETAAPTAARPSSGIELHGLWKEFQVKRKPLVALQEIDYQSNEGSFVALLGPSGCGKSTILRILADLETPTSGEALIHGEAPCEARKNHHLGIAFQEAALLPWRTVTQNIKLPLELGAKSSSPTAIQDLVKLVGLEGFENAYPQELSGGMKQRLEVARALAVNPDVLFLDEPFGALDSITRLVMRSELLRIRRAEKKTILFVTHDIDESVQLADRVVVMSTRPATIRRIVDIEMPHPRDLSSPRYIELRDLLLGEIGLAHKI